MAYITQIRQRRPNIPWQALAHAASSDAWATDFTHPLYRYPGSMAPQLARALILGLTKPGEIVLDPFCGGGTTAVEALAHGRRAICSDRSALACFVTRAKASPLGKRSLDLFKEWTEDVLRLVRHQSGVFHAPLVLNGGMGYAPRTHGLLWAIRESTFNIPDRGAQRVALLVVLRVGQLCFHCRKSPPRPKILSQFFEQISSVAAEKVAAYSAACLAKASMNGRRPRLRVIRCDAARLPYMLDSEASPALILTSPPYPGVHVLYHRWQVLGRRETDLPCRLLGIEDARSASHYTMGSRGESENRTYFRHLKTTYGRLRAILGPRCIVAQVLGFSDPGTQIPRFRQIMREAGYDELEYPGDAESVISRIVPNRRWYSWISPRQHSSREYLFIHRPARIMTSA
jgi:hypothetical protein